MSRPEPRADGDDTEPMRIPLTVAPDPLLSALAGHESDDVGEVATDALRLWSELENPEEMIDDVE